MSDNKRVLTIDGNFFGMRVAMPLVNQGITFTNNPQGDRKELLEAISKSFSKTLRDFRAVISDVIVVVDNSSWRKEVEMYRPLNDPSKSSKYKGTRERDPDVNWKGVFGAITDFWGAVDKAGFRICSAKGAEGDDWLYFVTRYLKQKNIPSLIFTSDGDMIQLVSENVDLYRMPKRVVFTQNEALLNQKMVTDADIKLNSLATFIDEVDSQRKVLETIVCGDGNGKDNIPPLFSYRALTQTKKVQNKKPTPTQLTKALKAIGCEKPSKKDLYDEKWIKKLIDALVVASKSTRDYTKKIDKLREIANEGVTSKQFNETLDYIESVKVQPVDVIDSFNVFESNRHFCMLLKKEIPSDLFSEMITKFKAEIVKEKIDYMGFANDSDLMIVDILTHAEQNNDEEFSDLDLSEFGDSGDFGF